MSDLPRHTEEERTAKVAVNRAAELLDEHGWSVTRVPLEDDKSIDLYARLTDREGGVTNLLLGIQVKGGTSFRSGASHRLRSKPRHRNHWAASSTPVIGIVHDPDRGLFWGNVSAQVVDDVDRDPVISHRLDADAARGDLPALVRGWFADLQRGRSILDLANPADPVAQRAAVRGLGSDWDDVRAFELLRACTPVLDPTCAPAVADFLGLHRFISHNLTTPWLTDDASRSEGLLAWLFRTGSRLAESHGDADGGTDAAQTAFELLHLAESGGALWVLAEDPEVAPDQDTVEALVFAALSVASRREEATTAGALERLRKLRRHRPGLRLEHYAEELERGRWPKG